MNSPTINYEVDTKWGALYYKGLERGKWVKVEGWEDAESGRREIHQSACGHEWFPF